MDKKMQVLQKKVYRDMNEIWKQTEKKKHKKVGGEHFKDFLCRDMA